MTMTDIRRALGVGAHAGPEEMIAAAKRLTAEGKAQERAQERAARDRVTVRGLEQEFASPDADGIDLASGLVHADVLIRLAARGITAPTEDEYAAEVARAWDATTEPLPAVRRSAPLLRTDSRPNVHHQALLILHAGGAHETGDGLVTQQAYDAAVAEVLRRAGGGR